MSYALLRLDLNDPQIPTDIRESCFAMGQPYAECVVIDGKSQIVHPAGAFGEKMDMQKVKYKAANAKQQIIDLHFYGQGIYDSETEKRMMECVTLLDQIDASIQRSMKEKGMA